MNKIVCLEEWQYLHGIQMKSSQMILKTNVVGCLNYNRTMNRKLLKIFIKLKNNFALMEMLEKRICNLLFAV